MQEEEEEDQQTTSGNCLVENIFLYTPTHQNINDEG